MITKTIIGDFSTINPQLVRKYMFAGKYVKDKNVLDLGCAAGYGSNYLAANAKATHITGVDVSKEAIEYAGNKFQSSKLKFQIASAETLPFRNGDFDVVVSLEVIEHVENYQKYLSELTRVLKPGGTAIISTPNKALSSPNLKYPLMASHVKEFYIEELENELKKCFKSVKLFGESPGSPAYQKELEKHFNSKRFLLQKIISQVLIIRKIAKHTPQWLNNLVTGGTDRPGNLKLEDVKVVDSPVNAKTIIAVCNK